MEKIFRKICWRGTKFVTHIGIISQNGFIYLLEQYWERKKARYFLKKPKYFYIDKRASVPVSGYKDCKRGRHWNRRIKK